MSRAGSADLTITSGNVLVAHLMESICYIHHDFLRGESRWNSRLFKNSTPKMRCPSKLALLALVWGTPKTYSGIIVVT
jgi:hypothetical protein